MYILAWGPKWWLGKGTLALLRGEDVQVLDEGKCLHQVELWIALPNLYSNYEINKWLLRVFVKCACLLTVMSCITEGERRFVRGAIPMTEFELFFTLQNAYPSSDADNGHMVEVLMAH